MESVGLDKYQITAISVSVLSLLFSIWNYRANITLNREVQKLNQRKIVAEHFSFYADLIHSEFVTLRDAFSNFGSLCVHTNTNIGNILDEYDTRQRFVGRWLRHLYVDLHDGICEALKHELPWQTVEHLNWRLNAIRLLDPASDLLNSDKRRRWTRFVAPRTKATFPELRFLESDPGRSAFIELARSLDETRTNKLISSIQSSFQPINEFFEKHDQKLSDSLHALESGMTKNKLEEFRLFENPQLYLRYHLFSNTLRFLLKCRLLRGGLDTTAKHFPVGELVVLGSTMQMASWLICETIFTIDE